MTLTIMIVICTAIAALAIVAMLAIIRKSIHDAPIQLTNTVTDEFIKEMIKPGVYIIVGPQGIGKTSFMNALISIDFKYHGAERLRLAQAESDYMNGIEQTNKYKLNVPPCAYRTRSKLFLPNGKPTYHTDISNFGLPGRRPDVHYFPAYTVVGCDEIDSFMDCRTWNENKDIKADIIDGFKYIRHHGMVFLGDAQNINKIDAAVLKLTTDVMYILDKKDVYGKRHRFSRRTEILRTEWDFVWVKHQEAQNAAMLKEMGIDIASKKVSRKCKLVYEGNIYKQYNSLSGKPYWYKGIKQFTVEKHPENTLSRDGVDTYCKQNALRYEKEQEKSGDKKSQTA